MNYPNFVKIDQVWASKYRTCNMLAQPELISSKLEENFVSTNTQGSINMTYRISSFVGTTKLGRRIISQVYAPQKAFNLVSISDSPKDGNPLSWKQISNSM